jgi:hypothetical protein
VLYLSGNQLILAPSVPSFEVTENLYTALGGTPWREIIAWVALPALVLVPLLLLTVRDPKKSTVARAAAAPPAAKTSVFGPFKDVWCVKPRERE